MNATRSPILLSLVSLLALGASGCIIVDNDDDYVDTGDLTLFWTFDGTTCSRADVHEIEVILDGTTAPDFHDETFFCNSDFRDGATIFDLAEGRYDLTIRGLSRSGAVLYALDTDVRVNAFDETTYDVDLVNLIGEGDVTVWWWFDEQAVADRVICDDVGISEVRARLYDGSRMLDDVTVDCAAGGVVWTVAPGRYDVVLEAYDFEDYLVYDTETTVDVYRDASNDVDVYFGAYTVLYWTFEGDAECGLVDGVRVILEHADGTLWDDSIYPCDWTGVEYPSLPPGVWYTTMEGLDVDDFLLYEAVDASFSVTPGVVNEYTVDLSGV